MEHIQGHAEIWVEQIMLPTYGIGKADKNPMFLEKRVYQGSSGKVYPLPSSTRSSTRRLISRIPRYGWRMTTSA